MAIGWFSQWFGLINLRSRAPEFHASLLLSPIVKQSIIFHQKYYGACSLQQNKDP